MLRLLSARRVCAFVGQPRQLHVFNPRTGYFDFDVDNQSHVRRELLSLKDEALEGTALVERVSPLIVAACIHRETTPMVASYADKLWASATATEAPLELPPFTLSALAAYFASASKLDTAFQIYEKLKQVNASSVGDGLYNLLTRAFAEAGQFDRAMTVFSDAKKAKVIPSPLTYTTILINAFRNGDVEGAKACATEMFQRDIEPALDEHQNEQWTEVVAGLGSFFQQLATESADERIQAAQAGLSVFELRKKAALS
eukprot:c1155_g1_i1.p1 GENE.c1155_g1_i1~~c1155_g1_i1.p1  ORF type:complete len:257 (+),score=52.76 c1155_g1_i1:38-808(+)